LKTSSKKIDPYDLLSGFVAYLQKKEEIANPNTSKPPPEVNGQAIRMSLRFTRVKWDKIIRCPDGLNLEECV
jgi:hypothetical protein